MDFNLTESEKMLQNLARDFALNEVAPRAAEIDSSGRFPLDLAAEMGRRGFQGLPYPAEYGGGGTGYLGYALVLEQICRASMTTGAILAINTVPEEAIFRFGSEEQKRRLLVPLASGNMLGGIAFTEAETGSDPSMIRTMVRRSDGAYRITGQKHFVAMAPALDRLLVFARDETGGLSAFIVDAASPGLSVREPCDTLGLRGLEVSVVYLDDVPVPEANRLGAEGDGFRILREAISLGRLGVAVEAVAVAQAALDHSVDYARERKARGRPIARMPSIQWHLAEMASRIEASRWLVYHSAFLRDQGTSIQYESSVAKLFASQAAVEVTRMALQVHGSYGTMKSLPVERLYRDAKMTEVYVGVSEIQRHIIASHLI